jgi:hypothetical protein
MSEIKSAPNELLKTKEQKQKDVKNKGCSL